MLGDAVALPSPGYPCYRHILSALGQRPVLIDDRAGQRLDADGGGRGAAADRDASRGCSIASPANPTGTMIDARAARRARLARAAERGVRLISDEIYHGLTYGRARRDRASHTATRRSSSTASRSTSR